MKRFDNYEYSPPIRQYIGYLIDKYDIASPASFDFKRISESDLMTFMRVISDLDVPFYFDREFMAPLVDCLVEPGLFIKELEVKRVKLLGLEPRPVTTSLGTMAVEFLHKNGFRFIKGSMVAINPTMGPVSKVEFDLGIKLSMAMCDPGARLNGFSIDYTPRGFIDYGMPAARHDKKNFVAMAKTLPLAGYISEAKSKSDWDRIIDIFGTKPLLKYLPKLPGEAKALIVENDFNL